MTSAIVASTCLKKYMQPEADINASKADTPNFYEVGVSALLALILLPAAYIFFKHVEATIADVI